MSEPGRTGWEPPASTPPHPPSYPPPAPAPPRPAFPEYGYPPPPSPAPGPAAPAPYPGGYGQPYSGSPYVVPAVGPQPGYPGYPGYPVVTGPGLPRPVAVEAVPGTPFGVAIVEVKPTTSGPATASLVVGIASIMVSLVVGCFARVGADAGWGTTVAGAFAVLSGLAALAAIWLCWTGLRRIRHSAGWGAVRGRGLAIAGLICGLAGLVITALVMLASITISAGGG